LTLDAEIVDGQIVLKPGAKLPVRGRALVTLMLDDTCRPNWEMVESSLGALHRPELDSVSWQRQLRDQWGRQ
jgi:hypothetical protein